MRALILCLVLATVSGCTRGLTPAEQAFGAQIVGETAASRVRLFSAGPVGAISRTYPVRPQTTCRQRLFPPPEGPTFESRTAGVALWDHIVTSPGWYLEDYLADWPERLNLVAAMFFAHELTHVWQWQNTEVTGFTPLRAAREHQELTDPYLFEESTAARFLDYGYEAQASLVEEYVCCAAVAPEGARTERLRALLSQAMPISEWRAPDDVLIPWADADLAGVCD
ncbi:hypothetical protein [Histidinibacterium aquaticum]|uniref:DUF4157 domain-containing protein n=1 Tax=Histidinibacterium aquaticum TaxID=2613962 RepID=A0A5J5GQR2_9RHOB|nr:hypothetical protein [Histidinibacterium aquaticum]KAA9009898.1 hypothetical protein F3S47_01115 [Histidinibacterium aquaticum]